MPTFLFTDIAEHTPLWEAHPEEMSVAVADCEQLLETAISSAGGQVVKRDGDAVMAVFEEPSDAVAAVHAAQAELAVAPLAPHRSTTSSYGSPSGWRRTP